MKNNICTFSFFPKGLVRSFFEENWRRMLFPDVLTERTMAKCYLLVLHNKKRKIFTKTFGNKFVGHNTNI